MLLEYKIKIFHCYLHGPAIRNIIKHVNTHTADTSALVLTGDRDKSAAVGASTKLFKSRRRKKKQIAVVFMFTRVTKQTPKYFRVHTKIVTFMSCTKWRS